MQEEDKLCHISSLRSNHKNEEGYTVNELRFAAACLEGDGTCCPSPDDEQSIAEECEDAQKAFRSLLETLPTELSIKLENGANRMSSAWSSESFERGFSAGVRLAAQILVRK